jgi:hypothetical protein
VDPVDPDPDSEPDPQHWSQDKEGITYLECIGWMLFTILDLLMTTTEPRKKNIVATPIQRMYDVVKKITKNQQDLGLVVFIGKNVLHKLRRATKGENQIINAR